MRRAFVIVAAVSALVAGTAFPSFASYPDVPTTHWAYSAIQYVSVTNSWMNPYSNGFRPQQLVTRIEVARALVNAFAPDATVNPALTFTDMATARSYDIRAANIAVQKGWLSATAGAFGPTGTVNKGQLDRALILALGLAPVVRQLNVISTTDGYRFAHSSFFGYYILSSELHLNFNYPSALERQEVLATSPVSRAFTAYALSQAKQLSWWQLSSIQSYGSIVLPQMSTTQRKVVEFAMKMAGYPYVYAGEWSRPTGSGYCCGTQLQGGFDCSGFAWWVLKAPVGTWNNTAVRGYYGWSLPQRGAADQIRYAATKIAFSKLLPGDLMGFNTDDIGTGVSSIDHAGIYIGAGWMIHDSGSRGGVSIDYIGSGSWWYSRFIAGRRLLPTYVPPPPPPPSPSPTPTSSPSVSPSPTP